MNKRRKAAASYCKPGWIRRVLRKTTQGHESCYIHEIPPRCAGRCGRWQPKFINAWRTPVTGAPLKATWEPRRACTDFFLWWIMYTIGNSTSPLVICSQKGRDLLQTHYREDTKERNVIRENTKAKLLCFSLFVPKMKRGVKKIPFHGAVNREQKKMCFSSDL